MSLNTTFHEMFYELELEQGHGVKEPEIGKTMSLRSIHEAAKIFQPRDLNADPERREQHIKVLVEAIHSEPSNRLDPLVVWWSGVRWYVIDGHHRLEAYKRVNEEGRLLIDEVPVKSFRGDLIAAMSKATRLNSKVSLAMTEDDKYNRAWLFIVLGQGFSRKQLSNICKVGTATISRMRTKLRDIQVFEPNAWFELASGMTWNEAKKFLSMERVIDDDWKQRLAKEWSKRLDKAFGKKLSKQPEIFVDALEIYSPKLLHDLTEYLSSQADLENPDF